MSEKADKTVKQLQEEYRNALNGLFSAIPDAKFEKVQAHATEVEAGINDGLRAMVLLNVIRIWILGSPNLGGEESPLVKKIDELIAR